MICVAKRNQSLHISSLDDNEDAALEWISKCVRESNLTDYICGREEYVKSEDILSDIIPMYFLAI